MDLFNGDIIIIYAPEYYHFVLKWSPQETQIFFVTFSTKKRPKLQNCILRVPTALSTTVVTVSREIFKLFCSIGNAIVENSFNVCQRSKFDFPFVRWVSSRDAEGRAGVRSHIDPSRRARYQSVPGFILTPSNIFIYVNSVPIYFAVYNGACDIIVWKIYLDFFWFVLTK